MLQFLPENPLQRSVEARALLVALAAAIDLRSASASEFAVKMLCRAIRTCLLNALASLRQTMSTEDRDSLDRAEADLKVRAAHAGGAAHAGARRGAPLPPSRPYAAVVLVVLLGLDLLPRVMWRRCVFAVCFLH